MSIYHIFFLIIFIMTIENDFSLLFSEQSANVRKFNNIVIKTLHRLIC